MTNAIAVNEVKTVSRRLGRVRLTKWVFPNSVPSWGSSKKQVFEVQNQEHVERFAFSFRAEIISDVYQFLGLCATRENDCVLAIAFAHVEMSMPPDATANILVQRSGHNSGSLTKGVALAELRRIMALVPDGHVMYESLAPAEEYTGERNDVDWAADEKTLER